MAVSKNIQVLKNVSLFSSLGNREIKTIASFVTEKSYKKNQVIFHQGDHGNVLFILKSGLAKISLMDKSGKEAILKMIYENEFFGEMSLLDGFFRSATVTATEDSKALLIYREDFLHFIKKHHTIVLEMLVALSRRLRKTDGKIASLTFFDSYGKVARVLLDFMEIHGNGNRGKISFSLPCSRQEMADMVGISRETVTRILNEFQVRGCLKMDGRKIIILDEAVLRREVF